MLNSCIVVFRTSSQILQVVEFFEASFNYRIAAEAVLFAKPRSVQPWYRVSLSITWERCSLFFCVTLMLDNFFNSQKTYKHFCYDLVALLDSRYTTPLFDKRPHPPVLAQGETGLLATQPPLLGKC